MPSYALPTVKALFARSGNRCAFPDCPELIVGESGLVFGQICHIKASSPAGPRYDPSQSDSTRNGIENLILLCGTHHKSIDAQPEAFSADVLGQMKRLHEAKFGRPPVDSDGIFAGALMAGRPQISIKAQHSNVAVHSPGAVQAQTVVLKATRNSTKLSPPPGTVGADGDALAYTKRLIDRYNEFAMKDRSRSRAFSHAAIYAAIKSQFGCHWNLVPMNRFGDLCLYLEGRIAKTRVAKSSAARGQATVSSFDAYRAKYRK